MFLSIFCLFSAELDLKHLGHNVPEDMRAIQNLPDNVEGLNFTGVQFDPQLAEALVIRMPNFVNLQSLNLGHTRLASPDLMRLIRILPPSLIYLRLNGMSHYMAGVLSERLPHLVQLQALYWNNSGLTAEEAILMINRLSPSIQHVDFSRGCIKDYFLPVLQARLDVLLNLTRVDLFFNQISDRAIDNFLAAIPPQRRDSTQVILVGQYLPVELAVLAAVYGELDGQDEQSDGDGIEEGLEDPDAQSEDSGGSGDQEGGFDEDNISPPAA